jgi:HAD superfamily hydrolase (TIGR01549 family)
VDQSHFAVTFDFHGTIAEADAWFALEVRELAPAFLTWYATERLRTPLSPNLLEESRATYQELRSRIVASGREQDAISSVATVLTHLGWEVPRTDIEQGVHTLMRQALGQGTAPLDGAIELVHSLSEAGVPLGIVSSAVYPPFLDWTLERFGIRDTFRQIVTSASAGYYKSDPRIYLHSAQLLGLPPSHVIHIGDSYAYDIESAHRAGHRTAWLRLGRDLPGETRPDLMLDSLTDAAPGLFTLLDELRGAATTG